MHIRRCQIYHYLPAWYPEPHSLKRGDDPKQTLLDGGICQPDQMNPYPGGYVNLHLDRNGIDSYTFRTMNVYQHNQLLFNNLMMCSISAFFH